MLKTSAALAAGQMVGGWWGSWGQPAIQPPPRCNLPSPRAAAAPRRVARSPRAPGAPLPVLLLPLDSPLLRQRRDRACMSTVDCRRRASSIREARARGCFPRMDASIGPGLGSGSVVSKGKPFGRRGRGGWGHLGCGCVVSSVGVDQSEARPAVAFGTLCRCLAQGCEFCGTGGASSACPVSSGSFSNPKVPSAHSPRLPSPTHPNVRHFPFVCFLSRPTHTQHASCVVIYGVAMLLYITNRSLR